MVINLPNSNNFIQRQKSKESQYQSFQNDSDQILGNKKIKKQIGANKKQKVLLISNQMKDQISEQPHNIRFHIKRV